jgi:hypothetical protein
MSLLSAITLIECRMSQETAIEALVLRGILLGVVTETRTKSWEEKKGEGKEREL